MIDLVCPACHSHFGCLPMPAENTPDTLAAFVGTVEERMDRHLDLCPAAARPNMRYVLRLCAPTVWVSPAEVTKGTVIRQCMRCNSDVWYDPRGTIESLGQEFIVCSDCFVIITAAKTASEIATELTDLILDRLSKEGTDD